jgi:hypothetical protein
VLRELRAWGARYGPSPRPGDAVRPAWVVQSAASRHPGLGPGRTCELRIGDDAFGLTGTDDGVDVTAGAVSSPEAVLTVEPRLLLRLARGRIDPAGAAAGMAVEGDRALADDVVTMLAGAARQGSLSA